MKKLRLALAVAVVAAFAVLNAEVHAKRGSDKDDAERDFGGHLSFP